MSHSLTSEQVRAYERDGYLSPLPVFSASEVAALRAAFEDFERRHGERAAAMRTDLHLLERWAWHVVTDRRVVDPVVGVLGEDVLLWSMNWFIKEAGDGKFVSLHQDANYWGLEPHHVVTAWIALSDAQAQAGPMRFVPGSHKGVLYEHENTFARDNLLTRGQTAQADVGAQQTVLAPLRAGEMSLHHVRILHGSDRNDSSDRRIGLVLRYCATRVRQTKGPDTAVLINGQDRFGHFDLLSGPGVDNGMEERSRHQVAVERLAEIIMRD